MDVRAATGQFADRLPREFKDFRGFHAGETLLVCGCGSSLSRVVAPERLVTIGVNDVGRLFHPDYLVVLNPRQQFSGDRFRYVEQSRARAVFSQLELGISHPHQVRLRLGRRGGTDFSDPTVLPHTRNSPYPALCLAVHMGARRIGLIGVDFTDHHFFAATGRHPLAGEFAQIDAEYRQLQQSCCRRDIEIFNLSAESRLTAFPKQTYDDFMAGALSPGREAARKVFFVNYQFLSCGSVFKDGLAHAADELAVKWDAASWDDPQLPERVERFRPDLVFVVHGRKFSTRWGERLADYPSALWLLDEPYEVDDTSRFSRLFRTVFVNDPSTLQRHHDSHYLPVCYDPKMCTYSPRDERRYSVGFIGGHNPQREFALLRLARRGLLSYVVGGPWHEREVNALCRSGNIPAAETTALYRGTRIVVNLFRTKHHYNQARVPAVSLNPRVYESLACGALVISEYRPELDTLCPEMPVFRTMEEMESLVERHLHDEDLFVRVRRACIRRLSTHTYAARLASVLRICLGRAEESMPSSQEIVAAPNTKNATVAVGQDLMAKALPQELATEWEADKDCVQREPDGTFVLQRPHDKGPGSERGLIGKTSLKNLVLEVDVYLHENSTFVAKIHQMEANNQLSNSYHMMCHGAHAYLARHSHIFSHFSLPVGTWFQLSLSYLDGAVVLRKNGAQVAQVQEQLLPAGYCFLGVKGGTARLRNICIKPPGHGALRMVHNEHEVLCAGTQPLPRVSIITTVYDRVQCLERCLQSVEALHFRNYEQIVVADAPPSNVLRQIEKLVNEADGGSGKLTLITLKERRNDWGISPAAAGLSRARGEYVCFLSDDNGYVPSHFEKLVAALDQNSSLGFVYSSCLYAGRTILRGSIPRPAAIDLGQPLFRRELFERYLGGTIPFHEFGWDWRMIDSFLHHGVRWQHVDDATFVFRLANYPQLMARPAVEAHT